LRNRNKVIPCPDKQKWRLSTFIAKKRGILLPIAPRSSQLENKGGEAINKPKNPYLIATKDGEKQFKNIEGVQCALCGTCKKWTSRKRRSIPLLSTSKQKLTPTATSI